MNWLEKACQLVAPPGVNIDELAIIVANQVANTVIHEAAHGKRWAMEYYTNKQQLSAIDRSKEEEIALKAEERAGLQTDLTPAIFDESTEESRISNQELLNRAISISNSKNDFYIPTSAVKDTPLGPSAWGMFEMIQGPGVESHLQISEHNTHIAWDEQDRKLKVDVAAIVDAHNRALEGLGRETMPSTYQSDGVTEDKPGVSQQSPHYDGASSVGATPAAPAREAR